MWTAKHYEKGTMGAVIFIKKNIRLIISDRSISSFISLCGLAIPSHWLNHEEKLKLCFITHFIFGFVDSSFQVL